MTGYAQPQSVTHALALLDEQEHVVLAGGTDLYPGQAHAQAWGKKGLTHVDAPALLDLSQVDGLKRIECFDDRVEIGSMVTWSELRGVDLPGWFDAVRIAARDVGGVQIQNRATLAGNLCNASPAADGAPALMVLDAAVRLESSSTRRELGLHDFILGNRRVARQTNELVSAIVIPRPADGLRSTFSKLGARRYLVISIAMVAVAFEVYDERINNARIAVGACSEVALRLRGLERCLHGLLPSQAFDAVVAYSFDELQPLDDVRGSGYYRRHAARVLVQRCMQALC